MPLDVQTYQEILKQKYWVFTAGKYPQGPFTPKDLEQIAANYDTDFCEAPLWVGHPDYSKEPEALAWVGKVFAEGDKLYVQFSYIDEQLVYMIETKKFKRVSVELWKFDEKPGWYLYAIGLTNRPQVKSLKPIEFTHGGVKNAKFSERVIEKASVNLISHIVFSDEQITKIQKPNPTEMKIEDIKKFAAERNIEIPEGANDQEVLSKVFSYVDAATQELTEAKNKIAKFSDDTKTLEEQITLLKNKEVELIVDFGVQAKRIATDEQKAYYVKFGAEFGPEKLKEAINALPVSTLFSENQVKGNQATPAVAKFKNADGSEMTYSDYLKKVLDNPKFADNYTDEEVQKLRDESW